MSRPIRSPVRVFLVALLISGGCTLDSDDSGPTRAWEYIAREADVIRSLSIIKTAVGHDGTIYFTSHGQSTQSESNTYLQAITPDGELKWSLKFQMTVYEALPVVGDNGDIYLTQKDGTLYAVGSDGEINWYQDVGGELEYSPAITETGNLVMVGMQMFYLVDPQGNLIVQKNLWEPVRSAPSVSPDGHIYLITFHNPSGNSRLRALDENGDTIWAFNWSGEVDSNISVDSNGTAYFSSRDPIDATLDLCINAVSSEGELKWRFYTEGRIRSVPVVSEDGSIYFGTSEKRVFALSPEGVELWHVNIGGGIYNAAAIGASGLIYVQTARDRLYAIQPNGIASWEISTRSGYYGYSPLMGPDGKLYLSGEGKIIAIGKLEDEPAAGEWPFARGSPLNQGKPY